MIIFIILQVLIVVIKLLVVVLIVIIFVILIIVCIWVAVVVVLLVVVLVVLMFGLLILGHLGVVDGGLLVGAGVVVDVDLFCLLYFIVWCRYGCDLLGWNISAIRGARVRKLLT